MPRFVTDEDFDNDILRALRHRLPQLDVVRVQDVGLRTRPDAQILHWSAQEGRILLTHDVNTMTQEAYARVQAGQPMPGLLVVSRALAIGQAAAEIALIAQATTPGEWEGQVWYLPL